MQVIRYWSKRTSLMVCLSTHTRGDLGIVRRIRQNTRVGTSNVIASQPGKRPVQLLRGEGRI